MSVSRIENAFRVLISPYFWVPVFNFLFTAIQAQKVEAESGTLSGTDVASSRAGYSGTGYVTGFDAENDAVTIPLTVDKDGLYQMYIGYAGPYGEKTNDVYVNGEFAGSHVFPETNSFGETTFGKVNLVNGDNAIKIVKNWGYFEVDYVRVEPAKPNEIDHFPKTLINPNASEEASVIYQFLGDYYGHRIIAGQQSTNGGDTEFNFLENKTGKIPAIKGFDLIDYSPSRVEHGTTSQQSELSIDWWGKGGVVAQMWHWNAPSGLLDTDDAPWWSGFYTYATTFDLSVAMNDDASDEYQLIIRDIDVIAEELKKASDTKTPLLWRPLHEAEGGWFWWGAKGPAPCVWLWRLMYDRLTNHHGLNNLIWVWTGTNSDKAMDWYPGDDYVDIIGADIYLNDQNYSPSFSVFDEMVGKHHGNRIITMSENGTIPDPDALDAQRARWSWFNTWSGDFIMDGVKNDLNHINAVYNHEYVITFDELPDFSNYQSPDFPDDSIAALVLAVSEHHYDLNVYPNPTSDFVHIRHPAPGKMMLIDVFDLRGKRVIHKQSNHDATLNLSTLIRGVYVIKVATENGPVDSKKILKE